MTVSGSSDRADVVIVGFGPVGAMLANLLGQAGVSVIVCERDVKPHTLPRAGATDDEVMRVFQAAGLVDELLPKLDLGQCTQFISARGEALATMRPSGRANGYPQLAFFYQPDMEHVLHQGLDRYPHVEVRMGHNVEAVDDAGDSVIVWTRSGEGGKHPIRAKYVVGCDGGRSSVRNLSSIRFGGATFDQPWLVVDARLEAPLTEVDCFQFIGNPARPSVTVPLPGTHHRWEFMVLPGEDHEAFASLDNAKRLITPWVDPEQVEILRHVVYTFHARTAERWRKGRVLLAGDAAHLMPPFAGQGLASGVRDTHNLAWKLAAVVTGQAQEGLLDTYETERRPHVVRMTNLTRISGALVQTRNRQVAVVRDALLSRISRLRYFSQGKFRPHLHYPAGAFDESKNRRGAGRLFPQPQVQTADGTRALLDQWLGAGWSIVGRGIDPQRSLRESDRKLWESMGASYVTARRPGQAPITTEPGTQVVEDLDGYVDEFFDHHGGDIAVIRPDRIVFAMVSSDALDHATSLFHAVIEGRAR
jgi:3-(3-hydroxy-phenyl)propionate hydroxylase